METAADWLLAELNVGRVLAPLDDPSMADFVAQLDAINRLAEESPGFVWRLTTAEGGPSSYLTPYEDPLMLVNLSVWRSVEELHAYVYRSHHVGVLRDRRRWFEPSSQVTVVLWWTPAGRMPDVEEAKQRLATLSRLGPSPAAFTFKQRFPPPLSVAAVATPLG
jgi:hypothetical protein